MTTYDEFGNYIGADLDSDDDENEGLQLDPRNPRLQGYDEDAMLGQAMEIDGARTDRSQRIC
jgi:hypothetical protein